MRKAIQLKLNVEISGHAQAPDEASVAIQEARDLLAAGHWRHPHLQITVKDIVSDPSTAGDPAAHVIATLWVEGEDAPADDFAKRAIQAVRDVLAAGHWRHPRASIVVSAISEDAGDDDA